MRRSASSTPHSSSAQPLPLLRTLFPSILSSLALIACGDNTDQEVPIDSSCNDLVIASTSKCNSPDPQFPDLSYCPELPVDQFLACIHTCGEGIQCQTGSTPPNIEGTHQWLPGQGEGTSIAITNQHENSIQYMIGTGPLSYLSTIYGDGDNFTLYSALYSDSEDGGFVSDTVEFLVLDGSVASCETAPWRALQFSVIAPSADSQSFFGYVARAEVLCTHAQ